MRTKIVRIGNSRGVRIPKTLIEQCGLEDTVELDVEHGRLVIRAAEKSRQGWDEAFRRMAEQGEVMSWSCLQPWSWLRPSQTY